MNETINKFIDDVIKNMVVDEKTQSRIKNDLYDHIYSASESSTVEEVIKKMGTSEEVAKEFMETMYENKDEIISKLIKEKVKVESLLKKNDYFEYKSKSYIWGLPLIHIKFRKRFNGFRLKDIATAKGILAIGETSIGLVSISLIPFGGLCIGIVPIGLIALGSLAFGALAIGGLALGLMSVGGVAIGFGAIGGFAMGKIAIGGYAKGVVAIGGKAIGRYVLNTPPVDNGGYSVHSYSLGYVTKDQIETLIRKAYPNIFKWVIKIFTLVGSR